METGDHDKTTFDRWVDSDSGQYIFDRQIKLVADLTAPVTGERVLGIDCGAGYFLQMFQDKNCQVVGVDASEENLKLARIRLGRRAELIRGTPEDLPFSDNEFDIVTLIYTLGTSSDPERAMAEAIRVSHRRVFIGFLNPLSFAGTKHSLQELFGLPASDAFRFFSILEMRSRIRRLINTPAIEWGSVIFFPKPFYEWFSEADEIFPRRRNPLGAFAGMVFPVKYTLRTVQSPVTEQFDLKIKSAPAAPEAVRGVFRGIHL